MLGLVRPLFASAKSVGSTPVTLSLNVTVQLTLAVFVGVAFVRLMDVTVGPLTSQVTVLSVDVEAVLVLAAGSETSPAATEADTVPVVIPVTARLKVVLSALGLLMVTTFVPPAVPLIVTSEDVKVEV